MSVDQPPLYYFTDINFNSSFYDTEAFTETQANALYLRKRTPDTATALETFNVGILSASMNPITSSSTMNIGTTTVAGNINIGTGAVRGGNINIGTGTGSNGNISISNGGSNGSNTNINSGETATGQVNLMTGTATGFVNIATGAGSASVNISNGTTTGIVNIGNTGNAVNINSSALSLGSTTKTLTVNTPIRINYAPTALTLSSQIGYVKVATLLAANTPIPTGTTALGSISLTAGTWILNFYVGTNVMSALTVNDNLGQRMSIGLTSGILSADFALVGSEGVAITGATNVPTLGSVAILQPTATTVYYLNYTASFTVGALQMSTVTHMNAVRIG